MRPPGRLKGESRSASGAEGSPVSVIAPEELVAPQTLPAAATARLPWTGRAWQGTMSFGLAMLGFFLLFSTAGTAIAMFVLLLVLLAAPVRVLKAIPWRDPIIASGLLLLAWIALRDIAETGFSKTTLANANHYHELLLMPLLYGVMVHSRRPRWFIRGVLAAALALALLSWLVPYFPGAADFIVRRRISLGFCMAVCAFLVVEAARLREFDRVPAYLIAAVLAATIFFTGQGRTGQLVLLLLAGCAAWRAVSGRWRLPLTGGAILLLVLLASLSHTVRERFTETRDAIVAEERGIPDTSDKPGSVEVLNSTAARIEIVNNALGVTRDHWLAGTGWQHYPQALQEQAAKRHKDPSKVYGALSVNPHDEFLLQLGAGGVVALLLFVAWLAAPVWRAWRAGSQASPWLGAAACVAVAFAVGSVFNSLLLDWAEAHFYVSVLAALLAWRVRE